MKAWGALGSTGTCDDVKGWVAGWMRKGHRGTGAEHGKTGASERAAAFVTSRLSGFEPSTSNFPCIVATACLAFILGDS